MLSVNTTRPAGRAGRISKIETLSLGTAWRDFSFVRLHTTEGLTGVGEITHPYRGEQVCSLTEAMGKRFVLGADPFDVEEIWIRMFQGDFLRGGDVGSAALSGIDQALHDIIGKTLGVPVYQLIGGACRDRLPTYTNGWYTGPREPQSFAARAKETVAKGYNALKFDPFGAGWMELGRKERNLSLDIIAAVRDAVGPDVELLIEGHARMTVHEAIRVGIELEAFDVGWFEEPIPCTHIKQYVQVRDKCKVPIAGGEHYHTRHDFKELFALDAVHIIQPDICYCGGFTDLRKIAAVADMHMMMVAPHNSNSILCTTATAHACFGMPNFKILETFDALLEPYVYDAIVGALPITAGYVDLPTAPGLGVTLNDEVFKEHPPKRGFWNMFAPGWETREQK